MKTIIRNLAIRGWKEDLTDYGRQELMKQLPNAIPDRKPGSLTGREIQYLYERYKGCEIEMDAKL